MSCVRTATTQPRRTKWQYPKKVYDTIKRSKKGFPVAKIREKTGFTARQVANAIARLLKKKDVRRVSRGVYSATKKAA